MNNHGYAAITSMLVISAVVLIISASVALFSVNDIQSALSDKKSENSLHLIEGCIENALLSLNENNTVPASVQLPEGTCILTVDSHVGTVWTFTATATIETVTRSVQVTANRTTTVSIQAWNEQ